MHVFVTGGSGLTGPAIVAELIAAGHTVTGLARSDEAAARLQATRRPAPSPAPWKTSSTLQAGAKAADGVIHLAFGGSFADPEDLVRRDRHRDRDARPGAGRVGQAVRQHLRHPRHAAAAGSPPRRDAPDPAVDRLVPDSGRAGLPRVRRPGGQVQRRAAARRPCTARATTGSSRCSSRPRASTACRPTSATAPTAGPRSTASTPPPSSGWRLRRRPAGEPRCTARPRTSPSAASPSSVARILGMPRRLAHPDQAAEHFGDPFLGPGLRRRRAGLQRGRTRALLGWTPAHPTLLRRHRDRRLLHCVARPAA